MNIAQLFGKLIYRVDLWNDKGLSVAEEKYEKSMDKLGGFDKVDERRERIRARLEQSF